MSKKINRFLALALTIMMLVTMLPVNSLAAETNVTSNELTFESGGANNTTGQQTEGGNNETPSQNQPAPPNKYMVDGDGKLLLNSEGMPVPVDDSGVPVIYGDDAASKPRYQVDENGNLVLDANGMPIVLPFEAAPPKVDPPSQDGGEVPGQDGGEVVEPADTDEPRYLTYANGELVLDINGNPIPVDENGNPIQPVDPPLVEVDPEDEDGSEAPTPMLDENGNPMFREDGQPIYVDENGNPYFLDENGAPVFIDDNTTEPEGEDESETPNLMLDENGNPMFYGDGQPIYVDENGNPYFLDENGAPVFLDENGEPIVEDDTISLLPEGYEGETKVIVVTLADDAERPEVGYIDVVVAGIYNVRLEASNGWIASITVPVYEDAPAPADVPEEGGLVAKGMLMSKSAPAEPEEIDYSEVDASLGGGADEDYQIVSANWVGANNLVLLVKGAELPANPDLMKFSAVKFWYGAQPDNNLKVTLYFQLLLDVPGTTEAVFVPWSYTISTGGFVIDGDALKKQAEIEIPETRPYAGMERMVIGWNFLYEETSGFGAVGNWEWEGDVLNLYNTATVNGSLSKTWEPAIDAEQYQSVTVKMTSNNPDWNGKEFIITAANNWYLALGVMPLGGKRIDGTYGLYNYGIEETSLKKIDGTSVAPTTSYNVIYDLIQAGDNWRFSVTNANKDRDSLGELTIKKLWDGKTTPPAGSMVPVLGKIHLTCTQGNTAHDREIDFALQLAQGEVTVQIPLLDQGGHSFAIRVSESMSGYPAYAPVYRSLVHLGNGKYQVVIDNLLKKTSVSGEKFWIATDEADKTERVIELLRDGVVIDEFIVNAGKGWTYNFTDLDRFAPDGSMYNYTIREKNADSYPDFIVYYDGYNVFNVNRNGGSGRFAYLTKYWEKGSYKADYWPSVTLELYDETAQVVVYSWNTTNDQLNKVISESDLIAGVLDPSHVYTLREIKNPDDPWTFVVTVAQWNGNLLILSGTNTLTGDFGEPVTIDIPVSKTWIDGTLGGEDTTLISKYHDAVFELFVYDRAISDYVSTGKTLELKNGKPFDMFRDIPKNDPLTGEPYRYLVREVGAHHGYVSEFKYLPDGTWAFTNTLKKHSETYEKWILHGLMAKADVIALLPDDIELNFDLERRDITTPPSTSEADFNFVASYKMDRNAILQYLGNMHTISFDNLLDVNPETGNRYEYRLHETDIPEVNDEPLFEVLYSGNVIYNNFTGKPPKTKVSIQKIWRSSNLYPMEYAPKAIRFVVYDEHDLSTPITLPAGADVIYGSGYDSANWKTIISLEPRCATNVSTSPCKYIVVETQIQMQMAGSITDTDGNTFSWAADEWIDITTDGVTPLRPFYCAEALGVNNNVTIANAPMLSLVETNTMNLRIYKDWGDDTNATGGSPRVEADRDLVEFNLYKDGVSVVVNVKPTNDPSGSLPGLHSVLIPNVSLEKVGGGEGSPVFTATENPMSEYSTTLLTENFVWDPDKKEAYAIFLNTYSPEKVDLNVKKRYPNLPIGFTAPSVFVRWSTLDGASVGGVYELNAGNNWEHTWKDLVLYTNNYDKIPRQYKVQESPTGDNGTWVDTSGTITLNGFDYIYTQGTFSALQDAPSADKNKFYNVELTNTINDKTKIGGRKRWSLDNRGSEGNRIPLNQHPTTITLKLYRTSYKLDNGVQGDVYEAATEVPFTDYTYTPPTSSSRNASWLIDNLPLYGADGTQGLFYTYYVKEVPIPGYTTYYKIWGQTSPDYVIDGETIYNTKIPGDGKISVVKTWSGDDAAHRPDSITVTLKGYVGTTVVYNSAGTKTTLQLSAATPSGNTYTWTDVFTGLDVYDDQGRLIRYVLTEDAINGYNTVATPDGITLEAGSGDFTFTIVNTDDGNRRKLTVKKVWLKADGTSAADIDIGVVAIDYTLVGMVGTNVVYATTPGTTTLNAGNGWSKTHDNLPIYHKGQEISYKVVELALTQEGLGSIWVSYSPAGTNQAAGSVAVFTSNEAMVTITNRLNAPGKGSLAVTKAWSGTGNIWPANVDSITFKIEMSTDGGAIWTDHPTYVDQVINRTDSLWTKTYNDLDVTTPDGAKIKYRVYEHTGNGFTLDTITYGVDGVELNETSRVDITITNTEDVPDVGDLTVVKAWIGGDWPTNVALISFTLQQRIATDAGGWTGWANYTAQNESEHTFDLTSANRSKTFTDLPLTDHGYATQYRVIENVPPTGATYHVAASSTHETGVSLVVNSTATITITNEENPPDKGILTVAKAWENGNPWPVNVDSITFKIQMSEDGISWTDTSYVNQVINRMDNPQSKTYRDLDVTAPGGATIKYRVVEAVGNGFALVSITGGDNGVELLVGTPVVITILNKDVPDVGDLTVVKAWINDVWPEDVTSISFTIQQSIATNASATAWSSWTDFMTPNENEHTFTINRMDSPRSRTFTDLPLTANNGYATQYRVIENVPPTGATYHVAASSTHEAGVRLVANSTATITITNEENVPDKGSLTVRKAWLGDNWPANAPASIEFIIESSTDRTAWTPYVNSTPTTRTLTPSAPSVTFTDVPKTTTNGDNLYYRVRELTTGTTFSFISVTGDDEGVSLDTTSTITITNAPKGKLIVEKLWYMADESTLAPSDANGVTSINYTVTPKVNGTSIPGAEFGGTLAYGESKEHNDLDVYDTSGNLITYYVLEGPMVAALYEGIIVSGDVSLEFETGDYSATVTLKNKVHDASLTVRKRWNVAGEAADYWPDHIPTIQFQIYYKLNDAGVTTWTPYLGVQTLDKDTRSLTYTVQDATPLVVSTGSTLPYVYKVEEIATAGMLLEGYSSESLLVSAGTFDNEILITNTLTEPGEGELIVDKVWEAEGGFSQTWPDDIDKITFTLQYSINNSDWYDYDTYELTEGQSSVNISPLPLKDTLERPYTYRVVEDPTQLTAPYKYLRVSGNVQLADYESAPTSPSITLTNFAPLLGKLEVEKKWVKEDGITSIEWPVDVASIDVTITATYDGGNITDTKTLAKGTESAIFDNLRIYDNSGNRIIYTVTESSGNEFIWVSTATVDFDGVINAINPGLEPASVRLIGMDTSEENANVTFTNKLNLTNRIGDYLWIDTNEDGVQNESSGNGIGDKEVALYVWDELTTDFVDTGRRVRTSTDGYYYFDKLDPGFYQVRFPTTIVVDGLVYILTTPNNGNDELDSDPDQRYGQADTREIYRTTEDLTYDAGYVPVPPEKGNLTVTKFWLEEDGVIPRPEWPWWIDKIEFTLYAYDTVNGARNIGEYELTRDEPSINIPDLDITCPGGAPTIEYYIVEEPNSDFELVTNSSDLNHVTLNTQAPVSLRLTNKLPPPQLTELTVKKTWTKNDYMNGSTDANNEWWPTGVVVNYTVTGNTARNAQNGNPPLFETAGTLTANSRSVTIPDLRIYFESELVEYVVTEEVVTPGFTATTTPTVTLNELSTTAADNVVLFNNKLDTIDLTVKKEWLEDDDLTELRGPIKVTIKAIPNVFATPAIEVELKQSTVPAENWTYKLTGLPKYVVVNGTFQLVQYTVDEATKLPDYEKLPISQPTMTNGVNEYTVILQNRLELIKLRVTKIWNNDAEAYRPTNGLKITITANENVFAGKNTKSVVLTGSISSNMWTDVFSGLPKTYRGKPVEYKVTEEITNDSGESIFAYEATYTPTDGIAVGGSGDEISAAITNELRTFELAVQKVWSDHQNRYQMRPLTLNVDLLAEFDGIKSVVASVVLTEANGWYAVFPPQPIYKPGAATMSDQIVYSIEEDAATRIVYTDTVDYPAAANGNGVFLINLTNTLKVRDLVITKNWLNDAGFQTLRPQSIGVTVSSRRADGTDVFAPFKVELFAAYNWTATVGNLPIYDKDGNEIFYTISETTVAGYSVAYRQPTVVGNTLVAEIDNTMDVTRVRVIKNWQGVSRANAPDATISLYADSVLINTVTYTSTNYDYTFENLPIYNASTGNRIVYRVTENTGMLPMDYYYVSTTVTTPVGYAAQFVVLNEYSTTPPPPPPPGPDGDGPSNNPSEFVEGEVPLSAGGGILLHLGDCFD